MNVRLNHLKKGFSLVALCSIVAACTTDRNTVESPDGTIRVTFSVNEGKAGYTITKNDTVVLKDSQLGLILADDDFSTNMRLQSVSDEVVDEHFSMAQGKRTEVHYTANKKTFHISNAGNAKLDVIFQVSDDGVAFRYSFPEKNDSLKTITKENTTFAFPENTTAFLQPMSDAKTGWSKVNPCYEEFYQKEIPTGTPSPWQAGWVYPALFHSGNQWVLITEAGLDRNYCGTRLAQQSLHSEYAVAFPPEAESFPGGGVVPQSTLPWQSPWRVLAIGSLKTLVESDLGVALANPTVDMDTSFIKPGHAAWSWALLKDDSTIYEVQKKYIDYAASMQWDYCLIDADWDRRIGVEKIRELVAYAAEKNIGILLWYNSAGDWNETPYTPKSKLLTHELREKEFAMLAGMGIKGVKIDFFGGDGQSMIAYYLDILDDAAKHKLLVNFHGATLPRGWQRTYPNLMSTEAIKGFEYVTFEQINADEQPGHCTVIPFTRNIFDPMDFTPLSLDTVPRIQRKTTDAFELALPVVFLSGIQHFVERPEGMRKASEGVRNFLRTLPTQWEETKFLAGYPGKDFVVARRYRNAWYIAGINGENKSKSLTVNTDFLKGKSGYRITDSNENVRVALKMDAINTVSSTLNVEMAANGGFVCVVKI